MSDFTNETNKNGVKTLDLPNDDRVSVASSRDDREPRSKISAGLPRAMFPPAASLQPKRAQAAPPNGDHGKSDGLLQLALLRELRAEVQDLQAVLESVRKGESTLAMHAGYVIRTKNDIGDLLQQIDAGEDSLRHLHNCWEQMLENPIFVDPSHSFSAQEQLHYLDMLNSQISKIVYEVGCLTIPSRVNAWLKKSEPGCYIPFHLVFSDEIPSQKERSDILNYLAWAPRAVKGGIVDPVNGLIYRYADNPWSRFWSIAFIAVAFGLITGGLWLVSYVKQLGWVSEWPLEPVHAQTLLIGWGAILAGIMVHIAMASVKRSQASEGLPPVFPLGRISKFLNAKAWQISFKMFLALIGLVGLSVGLGISEVTAVNAFLLGYSLDSVMGIFGTSMEDQAAALKQRLAATH